jgi:hypothetical protein
LSAVFICSNPISVFCERAPEESDKEAAEALRLDEAAAAAVDREASRRLRYSSQLQDAGLRECSGMSLDASWGSALACGLCEDRES